MSDIKLFRTEDTAVTELKGSAVALERSLQTLIERNMEAFLGVRFLASEFATTNGGRMDSLGIDENGSPVIIEYKRASNENIINQGLFYLDWLMDHRRDFEWLVMDKFGREQAKVVDWGSPRLICIAGDFTKFDAHAVNQMNRNIQLVRYRRFGETLLLFELLTTVSERLPRAPTAEDATAASETAALRPRARQKTVTRHLEEATPELIDLYEAIKAYVLALGDDIEIRTLDYYIAFRRLKNFVCAEVKPQLRHIKLFVKVDPDTIKLEPGFTRDVRNIGHFGTGDLEIIVTDAATLERAKPLLDRSFDGA